MLHIFPGGSDSKESACNAGDLGLIPGLERSPGEENGNLLQCSCLGNLMDRGAGIYSSCDCKKVGYNLATKQQQSRYFCKQPKYESGTIQQVL